MSEYVNDTVKESGGVISEPPSDGWREPRSLDLTTLAAPTSMLPTSGDPNAVPVMIHTLLAIRQSVNVDDPKTIWNAMEMYISLCAQTGMKITNGTMYMAMGVGRAEIHNWKFGLRRQNNPEYRKIAETCQEKFYDGFRDTPQDEAVENPLGEITDPEKLAEKYKDIITD